MRHPFFRVALLMSASSSASALDDESVTYCVENYGSTNECGGADVPDACDVAAQWNIGLDDHSSTWDQIEAFSNQGVDSTEFLDPGADTDPTGIDFADVALFVGNGSRSSCTSAFISPGDDGGSCSVNIASMRMDKDLDMMLLWSSNSVHKCVAFPVGQPQSQCTSGPAGTGTGYSPIPLDNEMKLINGFHGDTWIQLDDHFIFLAPSNTRAYVDVSEFSGWGENFMNFFTETPSGSDNDRCATSIVYAANISELQAIWEAGGFMDRDNGGSFTNCKGFVAPEGCNPDDGEAL